MGPVSALEDTAHSCATQLRSANQVLVVSHIDADGLTSAAVLTLALERASIPHQTAFADQLDDDVIEEIAAHEFSTVIFSDFGSGQIEQIAEYERAGAFRPIIVDHHQPGEGTTDFHLNPLLAGLDGATELSGAGTAYVLARALGGETNRDLAALAIVGAIGDMQASEGKLTGANEGIVAEGVEAGVIETGRDLALYGKQTRPLPKLLEYATEASIPGISNDESGATQFLNALDVSLTDNEDWRTWADLDTAERRELVSGLIKHAVDRGVPPERINSLVGQAYELTEEPEGTELRDASEFSTLLNATARYERPDVGLAVCLGDRAAALERARQLLQSHRRNLSEGLELVKSMGVKNGEHLQWFHAQDKIRPTIVGIVAGMALGIDGIDPGRPIIAFADESEAEIKVSARGTPGLVRSGLDLSTVMSEAATAVGGEGGGHNVAAGATIPAGQEQTFIDQADTVIAEQTRE